MTVHPPSTLQDRIRGVAVGAAIGDALGMPLEFCRATPSDQLVRDLLPGRLPAGSFTDDTEMALAVAESLLARKPLNPDDLGQRFVSWYRLGPPDVGIYTSSVLSRIAAGASWDLAAQEVQQRQPESAGNGSLMRNWPVALAHWKSPVECLADSVLQSRVTHPHTECVAACAFENSMILALLHGARPADALIRAHQQIVLPPGLAAFVDEAPHRQREELRNTGWVRHTLESAVWGLLTTSNFEEAVIQVANLGADADTSAAVVGALAGATYGLSGIPHRWVEMLRGEWPLSSGMILRADDFIALAEQLSGMVV
jgi:ADP-ribosyl-[dinitrogen reductase] hydrolase